MSKYLAAGGRSPLRGSHAPRKRYVRGHAGFCIKPDVPPLMAGLCAWG
jgi:hypothetical protein